MLKSWLKRLFGHRSQREESRRMHEREASFRRLGELAPLKRPAGADTAPGHGSETTGASSGSSPDALIRRQPVLNPGQKVAGYAFMLTKPLSRLVRQLTPERQRFFDSVLINQVLDMHVEQLLEHRLAYIQVSPVSLDHPRIDTLPKSNAVLSIRGGSQEGSVDARAVLSRLGQLRGAGLQIACDEQSVSALPGLLELSQYAIVDAGTDTPADMLDMLKTIRSRSPQIRLLARNLDSLEGFEACRRLSFDYFQGDFITSREKWDHPQLDDSHLFVIALLNQLQRGEEYQALAERLKQQPALSYRLLRHINSAALGLRYKIASVEQAMILLGRQSLYRWLTLLLFHSSQPGPLDEALRETALARARLMELLARDGFPAPECEEIFIVGLFSLADVLFHMPLAQVLERITLPLEVTDALLEGRGKYAAYLQLGVALEAADEARADELAAQLGLDLQQVNTCHAEALTWVANLLAET